MLIVWGSFKTILIHKYGQLWFLKRGGGVASGGGQGGHGLPTSTSEPKKVQQFQFQTSGLLLFMGVQKLYRPEISWFLPCMLQFLDNLWQVFIFSNDIREKGLTLNAGPSEKFLIVDHPKEGHNEWEFKHLIIGRILDLLEESSITREGSYKWSTTLSILVFLKIFSEVIVASKCGPLAQRSNFSYKFISNLIAKAEA